MLHVSLAVNLYPEAKFTSFPNNNYRSIVLYIMRFAITDIETTGSHAAGNAIIEVAVIVLDNGEIVEEYQTLINPEIKLPAYITTLTGIQDAMLVRAPLFEDIAQELFDVLDGSIFVAHNVSFDYSFIKASFEYVGMKWAPPKLDSIKVARKAFPGLRSYGLANICQELNIRNDAAHRAMGDARATMTLFDKCTVLLGMEAIETLTIEKNTALYLPAHLDRDTFDQLPATTGVYFLLNKQNKPIYIGKAKNIKKRVHQHFSNDAKSARMQAFMADICDVRFEETGTETLALLIEDQHIRTYWPKHNGAQKKKPLQIHVLQYSDQMGYERLAMQSAGKFQASVRQFSSITKATSWLYALAESADLDHRLLGLSMFDTQREWPTVDVHNKALHHALQEDLLQLPSFLLKGKGRNENENSFIYIEQARIKGYGFLHHEGDLNWRDAMQQVTATEVNAAMAVRLCDAPYPYHATRLEPIEIQDNVN
jgi:DNA polymerase III subunit epsilon